MRTFCSIREIYFVCNAKILLQVKFRTKNSFPVKVPTEVQKTQKRLFRERQKGAAQFFRRTLFRWYFPETKIPLVGVFGAVLPGEGIVNIATNSYLSWVRLG